MTQTDYTMKAENQRNLASVHFPAGNLKSEVALIRPFTQMLWPTDNSEAQEVPRNSLQKSSIDIRTSPISLPNMYPNNVQKHRQSETNVALPDDVHKLASGKLSCWRANEARIEGVNKLDWYEKGSHLPTRPTRRFYSHKVNLVNGNIKATSTGSPMEFGRNGSVVDQIGSASPTLSEQSTESAPILRYKDELTVVLPSDTGRTNSNNRLTRNLCEWRKSTQQDTSRSSITPPGKWTQKTESQFTLPNDKQTTNSSISRNSADGSVPSSSSDLNQLAFGQVSPGVIGRFSPAHSVFEGQQQNSMLLGSVSPRPNNVTDIRQRRTIGLDVSESSWKPPDNQADAVKRALMEFRRSSLGLPSSPFPPPIAPMAGTVSSRTRSGASERPVISTSKFSSQVSEVAGLTVSNCPSSVSSPNTYWVGCRSFSGLGQTDIQRPLSVSVDPSTGCSDIAYASLRSVQHAKLNAATQTVDDCSSPNSLTPTELTRPSEIGESSPSSTDWAGPNEPEQDALETWPLSLQSIVTTPSLENAENKLEPTQINTTVDTCHNGGFNLSSTSSPPISTMRIESAHNSAFTQPFLRRFSLRTTRPISLDSTRQSAGNRLSLLRPTRASSGTPINANNIRPDSQRCRSVHFSTDVLVAHTGVGQEPLLLSSAPLKEPAPVDEPQSKTNMLLRSSKRVLYNTRAASEFGPSEPSPHGSSIVSQSYQAAKSYT
ncbi:hypothetical protein PHET_01599 [Paragonimus heterotremus]|uniref:Uncharacterized protein n=1 Tax=Paragonimus heterotremus TaxID=100268 RepID=A0A8J4T5G6_9TREM|nr:hypothetical protein PHET_01599 [Paragonimus heterotremus]